MKEAEFCALQRCTPQTRPGCTELGPSRDEVECLNNTVKNPQSIEPVRFGNGYVYIDPNATKPTKVRYGVDKAWRPPYKGGPEGEETDWNPKGALSSPIEVTRGFHCNEQFFRDQGAKNIPSVKQMGVWQGRCYVQYEGGRFTCPGYTYAETTCLPTAGALGRIEAVAMAAFSQHLNTRMLREGKKPWEHTPQLSDWEPDKVKAIKDLMAHLRKRNWCKDGCANIDDRIKSLGGRLDSAGIQAYNDRIYGWSRRNNAEWGDVSAPSSRDYRW